MNILRQCLGICLVLLLLTTGTRAEDGDAAKPATPKEALKGVALISTMKEYLRASFADSLSTPGDVQAPVVQPSMSWEGGSGIGRYMLSDNAVSVLVKTGEKADEERHYQLARVTPTSIDCFKLEGMVYSRTGHQAYTGLSADGPAIISSDGYVWCYGDRSDGVLTKRSLQGYDKSAYIPDDILSVGTSTIVAIRRMELDPKHGFRVPVANEFGTVDRDFTFRPGLTLENGLHPRLGKFLYMPARYQHAAYLYICFERGIAAYDEHLQPIAEREYPRSTDELSLLAAGVEMSQNQVPFVGTDTLVVMDKLGQTAFLLDAKTLAVKQEIRVANYLFISEFAVRFTPRTGLAANGERIVVVPDGIPVISSQFTAKPGRAESFFRTLLGPETEPAEDVGDYEETLGGIADAPKTFKRAFVGDDLRSLDWTRQIPALRGRGDLPWRNPILSGDSVFVCVAGGIAEFDSSTGTLLASYVLKADVSSDAFLDPTQEVLDYTGFFKSTVPMFKVSDTQVVGGNWQGIYAWKRVPRAPAATD